MNYIVMDLEWNSPLSKARKVTSPIALNGEIIQIGAAKITDLSTLEIVDTFNEIVSPVFYTKMNKNVTEVTGITDAMISKGKPFKEVCEKFIEWCGEEYVFISWSENDIYMLEDNMLIHDMDDTILPACFDIQVMYDDQIMHEGRNYSLGHALWKLDILKEMQASHDAFNDVLNTVEVMRHLDMNDGLEYCEVGVWETRKDESRN